MTIAWIGAGSNVGERSENVRRAVAEIKGAGTVAAVSSIYLTAPIGGPPQRSFANLVVKLGTDLTARELLSFCQGLEERMGREATEMRWGPRIIDLDILLFGGEKISEPDLEIPHPRMKQRRFVLVPLLEVDQDVSDPWGERYVDHLDEAEGDLELLEAF
jgi:2-amino-4-hydroxy-6-hydroxymethyldihydropteridine diphosphokinase